MAVADFNGDGKPDIAVTDVYTQNLVVYLNDGTGKFGAPIVTPFAVPGIVRFGALVAGDVNEDGKQDLIVGPVAGNQVDIVLLGNGDGTFTQGEFLPGSYGFFNAHLIDLNGDKHLDFVSSANGNVYAAMGDGKGNFTQLSANAPAGVSDFYPDLAVGDFNGDKLPDFVTIGYQTNSLYFFAGTSGGNFAAPTTTKPDNVFSPNSITAADFNKDGKLDLVIGSANVALLIYGNGDGTFQTASSQELFLPIAQGANTSSATTPPVVASADMNADGNIDVVSADDTSNMLSVLLNDGTGTFPQAQPNFTAALDPGVGELRLVDLNGDGLPDVILTNHNTQTISVFLSIFPQSAATLSVQSSAAQALVGSTVTVTVQVAGSTTHVPSGTITLTSGTISFGQQTLDSTGAAAFTLPNLPVGQYPISASYSGDTYNTIATNSTALTQSITDFQLALNTSTQSVAVGASATYNVGLMPLSGFNGQVSLTCTGLPTGYACAPASTTVMGKSSIIPLVVMPPGTTTSLLNSGALGSTSRALFAFLGFSAFCLFRKRRDLTPLVAVIAAFCLIALSGCSNGPGKPKPYTGTSTFTIVATATQGSVSVSHQVSATLTVTQ